METTYENMLEFIKAQGKVYLAGPWFHEGQLGRLESVKSSLLNAGFEVFSPKDENLVQADSKLDWREQAFNANIEHIDKASFVLAITDGKDVGTIFETGYAYAHNIPVVYFAETLGDNEFNLMLAQSGVHVVRSFDQLTSDLRSQDLLYSVINNTKFTTFVGDIE